MKLFESIDLGPIKLANRIVMSPLTRSRAIGNIPNDLMAKYYSQRATAGLIITEGTSPSPNGLGYARIPGCFTIEQADGWKKVTSAVHGKGGKIFLQIMHCGRVTHPLNLPKGARTIAPSAITLPGDMWTDEKGNQPHPKPEAMSLDDIQTTIQEYSKCAELAVGAGFDGVELHAANGYLLEQFLNPKSNQRTDEYGKTAEGRMRFVLEVAEAVTKKIGGARTGIRVSPYGVFNDTGAFDGIDEFYGQLAKSLSALGLVYMHVVDHHSMGAPEVSKVVKQKIRENFKGKYILSGGYSTAERANADILENKGDLVAFGRPFISNPDLVAKLKTKAPLREADHTKFYTPGPEGYTDYV